MRTAFLAAAALLAATTLANAGGDAAAGRTKARVVCQVCHGMDGLSKHPLSPHIAGQLETYLVKALKDYKDGVRSDELMSVVAPELSDADIANLAAYYASIKVTVTLP